MVDLKKSGPKRSDYVPVSSTLRLQRQNHCAVVIQTAWRDYLRRYGRPLPPRRAPVVVCGPPAAAPPAAAADRSRAASDEKAGSRGLSDGLRKVIRLQLSVIAPPSAAAAAASLPQPPATAPAAIDGTQ